MYLVGGYILYSSLLSFGASVGGKRSSAFASYPTRTLSRRAMERASISRRRCTQAEERVCEMFDTHGRGGALGNEMIYVFAKLDHRWPCDAVLKNSKKKGDEVAIRRRENNRHPGGRVARSEHATQGNVLAHAIKVPPISLRLSSGGGGVARMLQQNLLNADQHVAPLVCQNIR